MCESTCSDLICIRCGAERGECAKGDCESVRTAAAAGGGGDGAVQDGGSGAKDDGEGGGGAAVADGERAQRGGDQVASGGAGRVIEAGADPAGSCEVGTPALCGEGAMRDGAGGQEDPS